MASWPTVEQIQAYFNVLDQGSALVPKVTRSRSRAINHILDVLENRFVTAGWIDSANPTGVPPGLVELCYWFTDSYAGLSAHTGPTGESGTDRAAADLGKSLEDELKALVSGASVLRGDDGLPVSPRTFATGVPRLLEPVFGMRPAEQWRISDATVPLNVTGLEGIGNPA